MCVHYVFVYSIPFLIFFLYYPLIPIVWKKNMFNKIYNFIYLFKYLLTVLEFDWIAFKWVRPLMQITLLHPVMGTLTRVTWEMCVSPFFLKEKILLSINNEGCCGMIITPTFLIRNLEFESFSIWSHLYWKIFYPQYKFFWHKFKFYQILI